MERANQDTADTTVLVVDDEEDLADLYSVALASKYDVRTATSGTEALEKLDETVEVVLLDRRMPGMTGDAVLAELRDRGFECQVAMLTAVEPDGSIIEMPFDDYRVKPVDESELLSLVDILLKRTTFDEQSQEFFRVASKKAALDMAGNDDTDEYEQLVDRMETLRNELEETLDRIGDKAAYMELPLCNARG
ncbi:MAG: response regulator [Halobacteriales archaeon]|nr:response regulator [Halobacteriales archaeon]